MNCGPRRMVRPVRRSGRDIVSLHLAQQKAFWVAARRREEQQARENESRKRRAICVDHSKQTSALIARMFARHEASVPPARNVSAAPPPPPETPKAPETRKPRRKKGFVEVLVTVAVWGVYLLLGVPFQNATGVDWRFAHFMHDQFSAPLGIAFLGFYGVQFWGLRKLDDGGAFRHGWVMALPVGFFLLLYWAAHAP
jgi:hypothetical protein